MATGLAAICGVLIGDKTRLRGSFNAAASKSDIKNASARCC
jgi:hypothetical protein